MEDLKTLIESLKQFDDKAFKMIEDGLADNNYQALEIFMKYRYADVTKKQPGYETKSNGIQTKQGLV